MSLAAHKKLKRRITVAEFLRRKASALFSIPSHFKISHTGNPPGELEFATTVSGKVSSEDRFFYGLAVWKCPR